MKYRIGKFTACFSLFLLLFVSTTDTHLIDHHSQIKQKILKEQKSGPIVKTFNIKGRSRAVFDIQVSQPGTIRIDAVWRGSISRLAIILNGPGQRGYYARKDGQSPLGLRFELNQDLIARGKAWKITVASFSRSGSAVGKLTINLPRKISAVDIKPREQEEKSLSVRQYQVVEARGYNTKELQQVKAELQAQKLADLKLRWREEIIEIDHTNPMAQIVLPLMIQRLEEKAAQLRSQDFEGYLIDVPSHLQTVVDAYKQLPTSFKSDHLHPRYVALEPGQRVDSLQLGRDLLEAVRPDYQARIQEMVSRAFSPEYPRLEFNPEAVDEPLQLKEPVLRRKLAQTQIAELGSLLMELREAPSADTLQRLGDYVETQGFPVSEVNATGLHSVISQMIQPSGTGLTPLIVPDFNGEHSERTYYHYKIALDTLYCNQHQETWWSDYDEPYFHLTSTIPRYDPQDADALAKLKDGDLYRLDSFMTRSYGGVESGDTRILWDDIPPIIDGTTYNTNTSFTIDLWEEDESKWAVTNAIEQQIVELTEELRDAIQEAVWEAVQAAVLSAFSEVPGVGEIMPQVNALFEGTISLGGFLTAVDIAFDGIDVGWIVISLLSGHSVWEILEALGAGSPELAIILIAIDVVGPALLDFAAELFAGNFLSALVEVLSIPYDILMWIVDLFTDIGEFFQGIYEFLLALAAAIDPDDHIQAHTVTIESSFDNIFQDADWGLGEGNYVQVPVSQAENFFAQNGYGPTEANSSLIRNGYYWQPALTFEDMQTSAEYTVYYNVKRRAIGGRQTFGYTVRSREGEYIQLRTYSTKSEAPVTAKVSIIAMNRQEVPFVWLSGIGTGGFGANLSGEREFYIDLLPGQEYELGVSQLRDGFTYGYVTVEEQVEQEQWQQEDSPSMPETNGGTHPR